MPISSGTVSKGEKGKSKFQTLNLNNVFSQSKGESSKPNQQKALFNKHGMSVLGKVPSARKPLNLPSLKSESTGNDLPVNLVPTGGSGWGNKPGETGPPPVTVVTTPPITTINTSVPPPPIVDKSWSAKIQGKPSNPPNYNSTHQSPLFNQEFPSLSGSGNTDVQYGPGPSLRPQTEGSWIQGGSHHMTGGEVGNLQGTAPAQDLPTETLRPEVAAILPSFMMKQETQFTSFTNPPPPRVAHRFSSHPPHHDNRFMQHPPPPRNKDHIHCAIVKEEELSKLENVSKEGGWTLHDSVDYYQQLQFSDDETEESENKENKNSSRYSDKSSAISENTSSVTSDERNLLELKKYNEILENAKIRKESQEQKYIESKANASKKLEALNKNIEERKKENEQKDERKTTGQPVVKDGNEFRQLTQLSSDKSQSFKEPNYNFSQNRFPTSNNKPPRLRKQEDMQHKGPYRSNQERTYFEGDYDRDNRHRGEYNSRDRFNINSRDSRDYRNSGHDNRKFSDHKSSYNRDSDMKYPVRYSDSSDPGIESRQRDSWERETPKRKDSERSKQFYEDENDRFRSDNDVREKNMKELNSWENDKHDDYEGRWGDQNEYDREEGLWEKDRRLERPSRPDSRDSRASRESKTYSDHNIREEKLNIIDDPEDGLEKDRKLIGFIKNTRGAGVPITIEKLEAAESKQEKSSVLVPLVRSDKSGDYKKDGKDDKKQLDAWSTPLNKANFNSEQKKEEILISDEIKHSTNQEKQSSEEPTDKDKDRTVDRKEGKDSNAKKEKGDRDAHHRDRDRDRSGRGGSRFQQSSRSNEWSNNYSGGRDGRDRNWSREGKDARYDSRRGHARAPPSRNTYSRHNRSESDPESGKEERYHEGTRERRVEKGRKDRDDGWFKERDHYYESRGSREYSQRGSTRYGSTNQSSGQGRRMEYGSSTKNFSGDEKKTREKKEATSEDDKKEKKISTKPVGKSGRDKNEKDWESDGKESLDDEKYRRGGSYSSRGSRGARQTYSARKNEKFPKERPVKEEDSEKLDEAVKSKESGESKAEQGFQEVKAKKTLGKEVSTPKKVEEKSKSRDAPKSASAPKLSVVSQASKSNTVGKGASQPISQITGKATAGADKAKTETIVSQQKKQESAIDESKIPSFSNAKDVMTGPPPPPPATNAWDRPLNSAVLKSASPAPVKTSTPPPRPLSSASSNAHSEPASHLDETSQQQQYQQSLAEHQQFQAQQLAAAHKQQQQVQQQALDKIDNSLLDGTSTPVPTMLFENRNYKSVDYRPKEPMTIEDYKQQQDLAIAKEDSSAADMKLDFTYGSDLSSGAEDHKNLVSHHHNLQHHNMVQSSAVELNWKIASVKSFWEDSEATKQGADGMVNALSMPHSGAGGHFSVVQGSGAGGSGQDGSPVPSVATQSSGPGAYKSAAAGGEAEVVAAELHGMYGAMGPRGMGQSAQQQAAVYANAMSAKEQMSKQQMAAVAQQAGSAPTPTVMSTPPPPQQQAQSYAPTLYAPSPAHQYSALPSQTAAAAMMYSASPQSVATAFGNFSVDQTAQLLSSAQATRQTTTQYPFLSLSQTFNHTSPNMYIHQQSTPSPASELASQMSAGYRLTAGGPLTGGPPTAYANTGAGLSTSAGPPNTMYIQSATAPVKSANTGVPPIGTKTSYQPSPQSQQMYIQANMFADHTALMSQSYLSQTPQQRPAPTGSSFYSTGTGGTSAQATSYYPNTYATSNPYNLGYGAQSSAPSGAQQMNSVAMAKSVVSNKYSQPPPQASAQQTGQVKYTSYQPGVVTQAQMIQNQQQVSQQAGGQQQVLLTPAHQQQSNQ